MHDGTIVTVPVFDMKAMLTSLLTDQTLMVDTNFAEGYNVLTGGVDANNPSNDMYGEVTQEMPGSPQGIGIAVTLKALPCQLG